MPILVTLNQLSQLQLIPLGRNVLHSLPNVPRDTAAPVGGSRHAGAEAQTLKSTGQGGRAVKENPRTEGTPTSWERLPLLLTPRMIRELRLLPVGRNGLYSLFHAEGFPVVRLGRRFLIPRDSLRAWIERQVRQR